MNADSANAKLDPATPEVSKKVWILGVFYFNPDDPRVLVPARGNLGVTLNFGHPRAITAWTWIAGLHVLGFAVAPIIAHPSWFAREPTDLVWLLSAMLVALAIVRFNRWFAWADYRQLSLASFGVLAALAGLGIQTLINGPLALWWGKTLTLSHCLVLAPVGAAAQTLGKCFGLFLLLKLRPPLSRAQCLRYGLLVGLGFTILEITVLYFRVAWAQEVMSYLSVWERASASMFHIYSAGLIVVALRSRRYWPILLVVGIHALMDALAGAGGMLGFSLYALESIFSASAMVVWVAFLLASRAVGPAVLSGKEIQDAPARDLQFSAIRQ
jgi:hypothetical protein